MGGGSIDGGSWGTHDVNQKGYVRPVRPIKGWLRVIYQVYKASVRFPA